MDHYARRVRTVPTIEQRETVQDGPRRLRSQKSVLGKSRTFLDLFALNSVDLFYMQSQVQPQISRNLPSHAYQSPEVTRIHEKHTRNGLYDLLPFEARWRDRQHDLARRGYRLRQRYKPGWTPSWAGTNIDPYFCEDSVFLLVSDFDLSVVKTRKTIKLSL